MVSLVMVSHQLTPLTALYLVGHMVRSVSYGNALLINIQYITIFGHCYDWLCGIKNCSGNEEYYLLNVYLPYESDENRDRFNDYMATIAVYVDNINSHVHQLLLALMLIFLRNQCLGIFSFDFCNEYSLSINNKDNLSTDTYTYVSSVWGTTSCLDHIICTSDVNDCITDISVLCGCINSDHRPVSFSINSDIAPECVNGSINNDEIKQVIHWDTLHPSDIDVYRECTKTELSKVHVPPGVKCSDPNCHNCSHHNDLDDFYDAIMGTLNLSSQSLM